MNCLSDKIACFLFESLLEQVPNFNVLKARSFFVVENNVTFLNKLS